ncbi:hypothetical protein B4096_3645 [Heyndrickxia coagulans]|uniref:Uncharacterized protein n=1 Tax=Heyndrickxia coagulans TaxID=1398 RepID=A0A133K9R9_HEYCO|nr:hypothetical protein HMPREF3213_04007 [Heyndrickxia coagulans]KYC59187.1 hypothetical protein B4100_3688 [Heyndrickxia coagulans]KYC89703.1 hypothetical protein B4096_3645 [Heyndrickxia coagulans]
MPFPFRPGRKRFKNGRPLKRPLAKKRPAKPARYRNHCSYLSVHNRGVLH